MLNLYRNLTSAWAAWADSARSRWGLSLAVIVLCSATAAFAEKDRARKRSLPPKEFDRPTTEVFSGDAKDRLRGPRPSLEPVKSGDSRPQDNPGGESQETVKGFAWSGVISADTLVDEIKSHRTELTRGVRNLRAFKSGGNRDARLRFTVIAAMFGIAAEYDGPVRWKKQSPAARDAFASAGRNTKAADDNTFKESRQRSEDLDELIRGGSVEFRASDRPLKWHDVAERPPLMQRLEIALEKRLRPWTANVQEFRRHQNEVVHEAEIVAAVAEIIQHGGYEYVDDDDYLALCRQLGEHAAAARRAAREKDFDVLQREVGEISKSCSACHEDYR